jgi:hypothetical protein
VKQQATVNARVESDSPPAGIQGVLVRPRAGFACGALSPVGRGQRRWRRVTMMDDSEVVVGGYISVTALTFGALIRQ